VSPARPGAAGAVAATGQAGSGESYGVDALTVTYHGRAAVAGVDLEVPAGTVTAVVGGDGAGKSTVLRALVGVVRPAAGRVRRPPSARIGYLSAGPGVWRDLTVAENLAFSGTAYGLGGRALRERADRLLDRIGLAGTSDRLGGQLSGGMRQKLALAMALLHEPELLVLDEPTTGVDPVSRAELWRLMAGAAAAGAAVVVATTYLDEAERASSVLVLDQGGPLLAGAPDQLVDGMPGVVLDSAERLEAGTSWRRGARWRTWSPDGGAVPAGARRVAPDLEDAVIVAALDRRARTAEDQRGGRAA
jgi:ABC-2 type transport system ATP-binding protein